MSKIELDSNGIPVPVVKVVNLAGDFLSPELQSALALWPGCDKEPHEILRDIANGKAVVQTMYNRKYFKDGEYAGHCSEIEEIHYLTRPETKEILTAAKDAAPYYAGRHAQLDPNANKPKSNYQITRRVIDSEPESNE